ncbi:MAG TPA: PadR family transcriptional regulator [Solirubrobacterales bacterium]|jgi:DNA-binding PadR family transcriptional regulator|nr:PadR family transcriptional regulator [Solirubrobacterales bacterium]
METLSPTAYVILGVVRGQPRSGYEIKALVDNSTRFFWAASYGQIYPELKNLAEAGLIVGSDSPTGGRRRTVYEITADGEEELRAWLRQPPHTFEIRDEGLLKLFFAAALPRQEALEILRAMRAQRLAVHERLRAIEQLKGEIEDPYPMIVLRGGLEFTQWFADWCQRMEEEILAAAPEQRSK